MFNPYYLYLAPVMSLAFISFMKLSCVFLLLVRHSPSEVGFSLGLAGGSRFKCPAGGSRVQGFKDGRLTAQNPRKIHSKIPQLSTCELTLNYQLSTVPPRGGVYSLRAWRLRCGDTFYGSYVLRFLLIDFVHFLLARDSRSKLHSPLARSSVRLIVFSSAVLMTFGSRSAVLKQAWHCAHSCVGWDWES